MKQTGHLRQQIKSITFAYQVVKCYNAQSNYDMKEDQTTRNGDTYFIYYSSQNCFFTLINIFFQKRNGTQI